MTSWRPGVQRPDAGENRESKKQDWKRPALQLRRKRKARELIYIKRAAADIDRDDPEKNKRAAKKGIERQFHRAVFLVGRTEDRDQKIFGDDHELVEEEEQ